MFSLFTYMFLIVGVNYAFACTPLVQLPTGDLWSPISLLVGFVFVVRDYAQRRLGHHVLWAMLAGCVASWYLASPELALASALAFAVGELADSIRLPADHFRSAYCCPACWAHRWTAWSFSPV